MEDWVYFHSVQEFQAVCLCSHTVFDLEGIYELEVELLVQPPCLEVVVQESYHIPNIEHLRFCSPVHVDSLCAICVNPLYFNISAHHNHSFSPFFGSWDSSIHLFDKLLLNHQVCTLECVEW